MTFANHQPICIGYPGLFVEVPGHSNFVVHQDSAPAHRSHNTVALIAYLRSSVPLPLPAFIEPENWPPNSPTLNLADYSVWEA